METFHYCLCNNIIIQPNHKCTFCASQKDVCYLPDVGMTHCLYVFICGCQWAPMTSKNKCFSLCRRIQVISKLVCECVWSRNNDTQEVKKTHLSAKYIYLFSLSPEMFNAIQVNDLRSLHTLLFHSKSSVLVFSPPDSCEMAPDKKVIPLFK